MKQTFFPLFSPWLWSYYVEWSSIIQRLWTDLTFLTVGIVVNLSRGCECNPILAPPPAHRCRIKGPRWLNSASVGCLLGWSVGYSFFDSFEFPFELLLISVSVGCLLGWVGESPAFVLFWFCFGSVLVLFCYFVLVALVQFAFVLLPLFCFIVWPLGCRDT